MTPGLISPDVARFIAEKVDSVAQMEALLLFHGVPDEEWTVSRVAKRLYVSEQEAKPLLAHWVRQGFIARTEGGFRYAPASDDLRTTVGAAAQAYAQYLVPVTGLIHAKSGNRIQEFADAFWIRKE